MYPWLRTSRHCKQKTYRQKKQCLKIICLQRHFIFSLCTFINCSVEISYHCCYVIVCYVKYILNLERDAMQSSKMNKNERQREQERGRFQGSGKDREGKRSWATKHRKNVKLLVAYTQWQYRSTMIRISHETTDMMNISLSAVCSVRSTWWWLISVVRPLSTLISVS